MIPSEPNTPRGQAAAHREERGQVFPLLLFVMLVTLALGVALFQVGRAATLRSDAQTAADAASLAAVRNIRDQIDRQIAAGGSGSLAAVNPAELRAAADDYAARNKARVVSFEQLGADVRLRVQSLETLGKTARPVDSEDARGTARARASMSLLATSFASTPSGDEAAAGQPGSKAEFKDKDFDELEEKIGKPPFSVADVVTLGRFLRAHGLGVAEHPSFGGVAPVHGRYPPNDHYSGGAIDVNSLIGQADETATFDAIAPKLKAMGWNVLWRVTGHAPGDNSHMHIDKTPPGGQSTPGTTAVLGPGGTGDVVTEIRLVSWEGASTELGLSVPTTGNAFGAPDMAVACEVLRVGTSRKVSGRVMLAAFETAIVESGVHNLDYGDRDSLGVFQQRPSQGWGTVQQIRNVGYSAGRFFSAAVKADRGQPVGVLAQDVQRSAFPERYAEREGQATSLIEKARDECGGGSKS